jgi:hypothetical protein
MPTTRLLDSKLGDMETCSSPWTVVDTRERRGGDDPWLRVLECGSPEWLVTATSWSSASGGDGVVEADIGRYRRRPEKLAWQPRVSRRGRGGSGPHSRAFDLRFRPSSAVRELKAVLGQVFSMSSVTPCR